MVVMVVVLIVVDVTVVVVNDVVVTVVVVADTVVVVVENGLVAVVPAPRARAAVAAGGGFAGDCWVLGVGECVVEKGGAMHANAPRAQSVPLPGIASLAFPWPVPGAPTVTPTAPQAEQHRARRHCAAALLRVRLPYFLGQVCLETNPEAYVVALQHRRCLVPTDHFLCLCGCVGAAVAEEEGGGTAL